VTSIGTMELTSQAINEAEFSMARRGYDPDQVDEFLEKLAVAVDKQNEALAEARERASMAERRANEAERKLSERPERVVDVAPAAEAEEATARTAQLTAAAAAELETLQRTLVLAQKTADATVRDAEEEAGRMIAKAESDARAAQEGTRARLLEEIAKLDADRSALQGDVEALEGHLVDQRRHVEETITDLQRLLSDPARLHAAEPPPLSEVTPESAEAAESGPAAAHAASGVGFAEAAEAVEPSSTVAEPEAEPEGGSEAAAGPDDEGESVDDEAWARFGSEGDNGAGGPPTQPVLRIDDLDEPSQASSEGEDAYLSELRKAMLDDRGAPGVDEAFGDDREARQRFGRRR
jgi:DivIVA domain-containing protein